MMCISDIQYVKKVCRMSVEKYYKLKFRNFFRNQNLSACVCLVMNPSPTILDNLKLERCFWIIFRFLWQILFMKSCDCKFITTCLDYLSFEF